MGIERVFCDVHGVLLDFAWPACRLFGVSEEHYRQFPPEGPLENYLGVTLERFWCEVDSEGEDFWRTLPVLSAGKDLHEMLRFHFPVTIVTSCHDTEWSRSGTRRAVWNLLHLPSVHSLDKSLLATGASLLIDDNEEQVDRFRLSGGRAILWPASWNSARSWVGQELAYAKQHLGRLVG